VAREIDGDTYFYRCTRKRQTATTLKRAGPRQFDTVYGKHISVAITSWGKQATSKQARLVEPKSTWCFQGWGRCASGRWRALSRPFVVPAIPTSIITQGMTVGLVWGLKGSLALGQRPLIYLAYGVLSQRDSPAPRIPCTECPATIVWYFNNVCWRYFNNVCFNWKILMWDIENTYLNKKRSRFIEMVSHKVRMLDL